MGLMVMASVVLGASLTSINTHRGTGKSDRKRVSDDELIIIIESTMKPDYKEHNPNHKPKSSRPVPECKTDQCIKQSKNMSQMMDTNVNPCTDFYQYACGGWMEEPLPEDHAKWTIFAYLAEQTENRLKYLIEQQKDTDNSVGKLVYNWYASCLDQDERDRLGAEPLKKLIQDTMGEQFTPYVPNDISDEDLHLEDVLGVVHRGLGVFPLFTISLSVDPRNSSSPTHLAIGQAKPLIKSHDVYLSQEQHIAMLEKAYIALMANITRLLGALDHQDADTVVQELKYIILLEAQLEKAMIEEAKFERENKSTGLIKWTISDFQANLPGFDWRRYFNKLTEGLSNPITDSEEIFVEAPKYLEELVKLLKNNQIKGVVANFITWSIIYEYGPYLSTEFHEIYLEYARQVYGIKKSSELWRRCVRSTDESIDMGVSMLYVTDKESGVTNQSLHRANQMVQNIREAFIENLETVNWMDSQTKQAAKEKAEAIFQQIGYPKFITNITALEEYFSGLKSDPKGFFQNRLREQRIRMENTLLSRGSVMSRYRWEMRPTEINAYYSPQSNKIVVPAGILRPPFYHYEYPHAENFGAIGFVVGHELTHGFDSSGALFDKKGNLANWWDDDSFVGFMSREQCLVNQYQSYTVLGQHLDGKKTLGENTADNGGLKLAYRAYHRWLAENDHDSTLPNLGLNPNQLFFLSFAQIWCEKATPSYQLTDLQANVHSPGKLRVDVTLKNNPDFANAFDCPLGSPMNPINKCAVW